MCPALFGLWTKTVSLPPSRASGDIRSVFVTSLFSDSAIYFLLAPGPTTVSKPSGFPLVRANAAELLASCVLLGPSRGLLAALESAPPSSQRAVVVNLPPGASIVPVPLSFVDNTTMCFGGVPTFVSGTLSRCSVGSYAYALHVTCYQYVPVINQSPSHDPTATELPLLECWCWYVSKRRTGQGGLCIECIGFLYAHILPSSMVDIYSAMFSRNRDDSSSWVAALFII